jgi:predicted transcriptional regulator
MDAKVTREDAATLLVRDVMVARPKTLPAQSTVAELRAHFENPRVRTALLADDGRFAGAIAPDELPASADDAEPASAHARTDLPSVGPDATMADAMALMDSRGDHRLIVLGADGETIAGLLCLDSGGTGYCSDGGAPATDERRTT